MMTAVISLSVYNSDFLCIAGTLYTRDITVHDILFHNISYNSFLIPPFDEKYDVIKKETSCFTTLTIDGHNSIVKRSIFLPKGGSTA